jgi:CheY-like chemotaxis protein
MLMPVMDGWAFARAYQQLPGPPAPIVVTAATDAAGRAVEIGVAGHCSKPFDVNELLHLVEDLTSGKSLPGRSFPT